MKGFLVLTGMVNSSNIRNGSLERFVEGPPVVGQRLEDVTVMGVDLGLNLSKEVD